MATLISYLRQLKYYSDRYALVLGSIGVAAAIWRNIKQWYKDDALAKRLLQEEKKVPQFNHYPPISILVAAWNEETHIDAHLRSFQALTYPHIELIICAGGKDITLERVLQYADDQRITVLEQHPGEGKQRALARCYQHVSGTLIYLTDADCIYSEEALRYLVDMLINQGEQVASGFSRPLDIQQTALLPSYMWATDVYVSSHTPAYINGLLGRNALITHQALEASGGMDFIAPTGTDYNLARRLIAAGYTVRFVRESCVQSVYPETLGILRHKQSRWLRNLVLYGRKYGAKEDVKLTLQTITTGIGMLIMPFLSFLLGRTVLAVWSILFIQSLISKIRYAAFTQKIYKDQMSYKYIVALPFLTINDFITWTSPVFDLLHQRRRKQW